MADQPNILYIATDQLRGDVLGYMPGGQAITPNLNRLAARSAIFTRCISNSPLCVPARAAVMTGHLPRETGVWSNARGADVEGPSHVRNIRNAGYRTAVVGKTHLWRTGPGPKAGLHAKDMSHLLAAWGFDDRIEVNDPIGTGTQGCAYTDYAAKNGFEAEHRQYIMQWRKQLASGKPEPWNQPPAPAPHHMDIDSFIGMQGINWLRGYSASKPFYLQVQFTGPHDPYDGPLHYRAFYDDVEIDTGISALPDNPPPILKRRINPNGSIARATSLQRRQWRINYYANVSLIDYWVGELLATLSECGAAKNTWIVFTSDHGEMLGDLGLIGKTVYFEPSLHIPLLISAPGGAASNNSALVEHVDVTATLLDLAEAELFGESLGRSLVPEVQTGNADTPPKVVYSELFGETTVVTERFKFTAQAETLRRVQLLDREKDPSERHNFVDDPDYAETIDEITEEHLEPLRPRLHEPHMKRYREYVKREGRLN